MKSLSEYKRPWSVMPMRVFKDRTLKERELRVLGALCSFTNRAGVCWPSLETICQATGYAEHRTPLEALKVLKAKKYVRQLKPKDYQRGESGWYTNRYQVLWDGDEPLPTYEEVQSARPLQMVVDQEVVQEESKGGMGDVELLSHSLAHAYLAAVQKATGQVRLFDNEIAHARKLADQGHTPNDVTAATLVVCDQAIERRAGVPSLADVARYMGAVQ